MPQIHVKFIAIRFGYQCDSKNFNNICFVIYKKPNIYEQPSMLTKQLVNLITEVVSIIGVLNICDRFLVRINSFSVTLQRTV